MATPHGYQLIDEDKDFNRDINSSRAAIENINRRLQSYATLGCVYRASIDNFDKVTKIAQVISARCNLNFNRQLVRR